MADDGPAAESQHAPSRGTGGHVRIDEHRSSRGGDRAILFDQERTTKRIVKLKREGIIKMPSFGVIVAIMNNGKILLTKREDFEVWCLLGGGVEDGESLAKAAIREAKEETGLDVELTGL